MLCSWDCPGKKTGVGCHFLLQGNLPDPGIERSSPARQADSLLLSLLEGRVLASHLASPPSQMCVAPPALGGGLESRTRGCRDQRAGVRGPSAPGLECPACGHARSGAGRASGVCPIACLPASALRSPLCAVPSRPVTVSAAECTRPRVSLTRQRLLETGTFPGDSAGSSPPRLLSPGPRPS